jgi:hypothetical protein
VELTRDGEARPRGPNQERVIFEVGPVSVSAVRVSVSGE